MKKILKMNEYNAYTATTPLTEDEMMTMCNIGWDSTGVNDVIMWIGPDPEGKKTYIKVSNVPKRCGFNDCFTITIPDLDVIGYVNRTFIIDNVLEQIFEFIRMNYDAIMEYSAVIGLPTNKFLDKLIPVKNNETVISDKTLIDKSLLEMANLGDDKTGIENVILWVGPNPGAHGKRIKVSNIANTWSSSDNFTITIPEFKIIGDVNKSVITNKKMVQIIKFIKLNIDILSLYQDEKLLTAVFYDKIIPIID